MRLGKPNSRTQSYPRFSEAEFADRRTRVRRMMRKNNLDALVVYGDAGLHQANIRYLTNYNPPFLTYLVFFADPDEAPTLFVGVSNHLQYIREVSVIDDLRLLLPNPAKAVTDRLEGVIHEQATVGVVGSDPRYDLSIPYEHKEVMENNLAADLGDATAQYQAVRAVKSEAELDLLREVGKLTDRGMEALAAEAEPGVREVDLGVAMERAFLDGGGTSQVSFIASGPMERAEPGACLPWKHPSQRKLQRGDIITTEIGAAKRGYATQIHRPLMVSDEPSATYRQLFDIAKETYENIVESLTPGATAAEVHKAMAPIENSNYKLYDVIVHGYGDGYCHPFIGTTDSNYWPCVDDPITEKWAFKENMVVAIQPNVVTEDETLGLQFGSTVVIQKDGIEDLHGYPLEFLQV